MSNFDYDFFVIGGGSGGLAASKKAATLGAKVACADFVEPSSAGTTWGLGGTCVNVGCIPKKLCHFSAQATELQQDLHGLGWEFQAKHSWENMIDGINAYIKSNNFGYKTDLRSHEVKYYNKFATFVDAHTIQLKDKKGAVETVTADKVLICSGGRPNYTDVPGAHEACITSDDIFWMKKAPGKTLVVGASYIALECAGFLAGLGFDTTVMVRSILLRGFDEEMAQKIGDYMESHGNVKFARQMVPSKYEKMEDGRVKVFVNDSEYGIYDTVLLAVGRTGLGAKLDLDKAGIKWNAKTGKVFVDDADKTNVDNIWAIGDIAEGKLELTPVAIQAGKALCERLFGVKKKLMDYANVATTVFTPLEYGCVGLSEAEALEKVGQDKLRIYHRYFTPLEWKCNHDREDTSCYIKIVCEEDNAFNEKVVGIHILGPNAGEIIQGYATAMKCGNLTKEIMDDTVGIHPTCAESLTDVDNLKMEGEALEPPKGC